MYTSRRYSLAYVKIFLMYLLSRSKFTCLLHPFLFLTFHLWKNLMINEEIQIAHLPWSQHYKPHRLEITDYEPLIAKFRLKLKKVGKTTRPFRYDLNQIPYSYMVEVTYRFMGLDLIECLKNYRWRFVALYRRQWSRPSPRKRNTKRQNGCLRSPYKLLEKKRC